MAALLCKTGVIVETIEAVGPRRGFHVLGGLGSSLIVNFNCMDGSSSGPLRQHDGNKARTRADVKDVIGSHGV